MAKLCPEISFIHVQNFNKLILLLCLEYPLDQSVKMYIKNKDSRIFRKQCCTQLTGFCPEGKLCVEAPKTFILIRNFNTQPSFSELKHNLKKFCDFNDVEGCKHNHMPETDVFPVDIHVYGKCGYLSL
jgi:hypothetical protein